MALKVVDNKLIVRLVTSLNYFTLRSFCRMKIMILALNIMRKENVIENKLSVDLSWQKFDKVFDFREISNFRKFNHE